MGELKLRKDIKALSLPSRILICGLGSIGRRHLRVLRKHWPNLDIAVLRSGSGPACQESELANQVFISLDDALAWSPEAAIIATPATDHLSKSLPLARNGVPLLIEKPVGAGCELPEDWQELLDLSKTLPIVVAYVLRHHPCVNFLQDQLNAGKIGKFVEADFYCGSWLPDWRSGLDYRSCVSARRDLGGGVLLELSHELDLAQFLLGPIELDSSLFEQSKLLEIDVEDKAILIGRSADGCFVTIRLNFCTKPAKRHAIIRGSAGEICCNLIESMVAVTQDDIPAESYDFTPAVSIHDGYYLQMKHFLDCVARIALPMCTLSEGLQALDLVTQARQKNLGLLV